MNDQTLTDEIITVRFTEPVEGADLHLGLVEPQAAAPAPSG